MATRTEAEAPQFPLTTWGPKGEHACLGSHRFVTFGATGGISPTMSGGIPGLTATKIAAGIYRLAHPPCPTGVVDVYLEVGAPSGVAPYAIHQVSEQGHTGATGFLDFRIFAPNAGTLVTPPTGTTIKALVYVAPHVRF